MHEGITILTKNFQLEKRPEQWKITLFNDSLIWDHTAILVQKHKPEFPKAFPDYHRSPRLHLEVEEEIFTIEDKERRNEDSKNSLLKMIIPPLAMVGMTAATTMLSGKNMMMMVSMAGASILTASFTVSQYITDKKENNRLQKENSENYDRYLVDAIGKIQCAYEKETAVLQYQQPTPQQLCELINHFDARIYERQRHNRDFLTISLGLSDNASHVQVKSHIDPKDNSKDAIYLRDIIEQFSMQRSVATPVSLLGQTLGLVGRQEENSKEVENILLQTAFFHSYRDVNFINILSKDAYYENWKAWRLLPHFKLQELNMRGLVYNEKLRDVVLHAFYQLLNKRKQVLEEAGRETPQFSPHYIFTIFDDSLLMGHGINEFLFEDMSVLGVSVIWCKEDSKLLPETVTSLITLPNTSSGELVTNENVYLAKPFMQYPPITHLENSLRRLSNLHHTEIEKNAVPESLSLLEQYEVKTVDELQIDKRWQQAKPNKSIRSLIGWRGKSDYVYWDLHERAHGPHALVGGTTGSGKSEFLTTYLIGLAINFSPEDVGMLIIDWKGGGIANTLDRLPHFMGAITNLDGAGTARALASIKAELDKRQREFATYGVNNINGYMSLYKERTTPKPDVLYPSKPLPHLVLVSDEFAELKANVPEFLEELTSVARIGRSLGVHLILATQKPSGVVNDQIEANSRSKIALKMASEQDSSELLKTSDAAHITNPGRGYLKVGQNEVYELFQSGYAGIPYDPDATQEEKIDERMYRINDLGQYELFYDPGEEVVQGKDTSDLPTQLEAVISEIEQVFHASSSIRPDKPWLPNLLPHVVTPKSKQEEQRTLEVPLGLLDLASKQAQEPYLYDLQKASHTAIFGSPGYGKSTLLQTLVVNLTKVNTPMQVQFNVLDFGNNGLLPLKDLPHVADIVSLEENEKLQKMLQRIVTILTDRKRIFKEVGVANIEQYEAKTKRDLPIIVVILDSYDALSINDNRKEMIDTVLLQLLREGASQGVYLVLTSNRVNSIRMNMMSNIATKMCLYLNDESELSTLMGRDRLLQEDIVGRGQVLLETPTAIQFYLPMDGKTSADILENLVNEIEQMSRCWKGSRPDKIPMVPEHVHFSDMDQAIGNKEGSTCYLGFDKATAGVEPFLLGQGKTLGIFMESKKQQALLQDWLSWQLPSLCYDVIVIDATNTLSTLESTIITKNDLMNRKEDIQQALKALVHQNNKYLIICNGINQIIECLQMIPTDFFNFIEELDPQIQFILMDTIANVGGNYSLITKAVKENVNYLLIGGEVSNQNFIDVTPELRKMKNKVTEMLYICDDALQQIVIATKGERDE